MSAKLTELGIMVRHRRLSAGRTMADHARALGCSASYISQIETGKIPPPLDYVSETARWLGLDDDDELALRRAADRRRRTVRIRPKDDQRAALAGDFERCLNNLTPEDLTTLRITIQNAHRKQYTDQQIESLALALRKLLGVDDRVLFDVLQVVEVVAAKVDPNFVLSIYNRTNSRPTRVRGISSGSNIALAEDVYLGANDHQPAARKTVLHEFAHFLLHRRELTDGGFHSRHHYVYEREANLFVRRFAFPRHIALRFNDADEASRICRLPLWLVKECYAEYGFKRAPIASPEVRDSKVEYSLAALRRYGISGWSHDREK